MSNRVLSEFGDFLRSRRERLSPEAAGIQPGQRRRTAGLRREEVAELAGIGVDWYTRLEQGRDVSPSATAVDALARALRLGQTEHAHLRMLARHSDRRAFSREIVPEHIERLVRSLNQPAYVTGRRWDILAWNASAADIFTDFGQLPEDDRNILVYVLLNPEARLLFGASWTNEAQRMVAQFRASHAMWSRDPAFMALLERLRQRSPEFALWWEMHDIRAADGGWKVLDHPQKGVMRLEHASFQSNDDPALKLVIYTAQ